MSEKTTITQYRCTLCESECLLTVKRKGTPACPISSEWEKIKEVEYLTKDLEKFPHCDSRFWLGTEIKNSDMMIIKYKFDDGGFHVIGPMPSYFCFSHEALADMLEHETGSREYLWADFLPYA